MQEIIPALLLKLDMCLSDIESMLDSLLYMLETTAHGDRERVFNNSVTMLYLLLEKAHSAHESSEALHRAAYRRASA